MLVSRKTFEALTIQILSSPGTSFRSAAGSRGTSQVEEFLPMRFLCVGVGVFLEFPGEVLVHGLVVFQRLDTGTFQDFGINVDGKAGHRLIVVQLV